MARLILSMDNLVLKEIPLDKEKVTIGRKPQNDIQIDNLAISGAHAVVVSILNDSFLEDLDSTNGTFVNGRQIKKHFLQNNDVIELGKYRLKYVREANPQAAPDDCEKTMVLRPDMMRRAADPVAALATPAISAQAFPPAAAPVSPVPAASPAPPVATERPATPASGVSTGPARESAAALPLGAIQVLTGSNAGKMLDLVKSLTTMGKPGVQVAVITRRPQGYFLTHVEGPHRPRVNGSTIDIQAHALNDHDIIELAGIKMEFFLKG